jgi:hypothetical protein
MDWARVATDVVLVAFGFVLAMLWDVWKASREWDGCRRALGDELRANRDALKGRLDKLPTEIREAAESFHAEGGTASFSNAVLLKLPMFSSPLQLKTSVWESIVARGMASRLGKAYQPVADAYSELTAANHFAGLTATLFELSLDPSLKEEDQKAFRQGAQTAAIYPETHSLPVVRRALEAIEGVEPSQQPAKEKSEANATAP